MFREKRLVSSERRSFQITIGLMEGYNTGVVHTYQEVLDLINIWMRNRMRSGSSCITSGTLINGTMLYTWNSEATGIVTNQENVVMFVGEVNSIHNPGLSDDDAVVALKDLATFLGGVLKQTRMYIMFKKRIIVLENTEVVHPTAKKA